MNRIHKIIAMESELDDRLLDSSSDDESMPLSILGKRLDPDPLKDEPLLEEMSAAAQLRLASERENESSDCKAYRKSKQYLRKMNTKNPSTLTDAEKDLVQQHTTSTERFESRQELTDAVEVKTEPPDSLDVDKSTCFTSAQNRNTATVYPVLKSEESTYSSDKQDTKRPRLCDESQREAKKAKPCTPIDLQIAVVDRSDIDGRITPSDWLKVEARILQEMIADDVAADELIFDGSGWQRGVKVVRAGNIKSLDFIKRVINNCGEIWFGAKLEVVKRSELPRRPLITLWIPPPPILDNAAVLKLIGRQNGKLKAQSWQVISSTTSKTGVGRDYVIAIDQQSLAHLRINAGNIKFGLGEIKARLLGERDGSMSTAAKTAKN